LLLQFHIFLTRKSTLVFRVFHGQWDGSRVELGTVVHQASQLHFWYWGYGYHPFLAGCVWQIGYATSDVVSFVPGPPSGVPTEFSLFDAYPNPFNPSTTIEFAVPVKSRVQVKVFDILGKEVAVLLDEVRQPGYHKLTWNPTDNASGVYYYRLTAENFSETKKVVFLR